LALGDLRKYDALLLHLLLNVTHKLCVRVELIAISSDLLEEFGFPLILRPPKVHGLIVFELLAIQDRVRPHLHEDHIRFD
jgi:hypothetical protein